MILYLGALRRNDAVHNVNPVYSDTARRPVELLSCGVQL